MSVPGAGCSWPARRTPSAARSRASRGGAARLALGGRDEARLSAMADELGAVTTTAGDLMVEGEPERVVDVRPPHMAPGLETRPIAGEPPRLPHGQDPGESAARVADAIEDEGRTEVGPGE